MLIHDRVWDNCQTCGKHERLIEEAVYGCDECKSAIGENYLRVTAFYHSGDNHEFQLCSWKCVFKILTKVKSDYFIDLPTLSFDDDDHGLDEFSNAARDIFGLKE